MHRSLEKAGDRDHYRFKPLKTGKWWIRAESRAVGSRVEPRLRGYSAEQTLLATSSLNGVERSGTLELKVQLGVAKGNSTP